MMSASQKYGMAERKVSAGGSKASSREPRLQATMIPNNVPLTKLITTAVPMSVSVQGKSCLITVATGVGK